MRRSSLVAAVAALVLIAAPAVADDTPATIIGGALAAAPAPAFLTGDRHFLITFDTRAKGVLIDDKLRAGFPELMTIILQHDFLVLWTAGESFTVVLHFDGVEKALTIPYAAVTRFDDLPAGRSLTWDVRDPDGAVLPKR